MHDLIEHFAEYCRRMKLASSEKIATMDSFIDISTQFRKRLTLEILKLQHQSSKSIALFAVFSVRRKSRGFRERILKSPS